MINAENLKNVLLKYLDNNSEDVYNKDYKATAGE